MMNKDRKSRDDKSDWGNDSRSGADRTGRPGRKPSNEDRGSRSFGNNREHKADGNYGGRRQERNDRGYHSEQNDRPANRYDNRGSGKFTDRNDRSARGDYRDRPNNRFNDGERKDRGFTDRRDDRANRPRTFKAANSNSGITPSKRFQEDDGQRNERFSDNRPFRLRDEADFRNKAKSFGNDRPASTGKRNKPENDDLIRLNRYISNSGICSRRKADELIAAGTITVNGEAVKELGHKVNPYKDEVRYNGELLKREKKIYVLLNKPKDYITTTDDPQERRTVMQLVDKASKERIYPVGRLDRNTTGLLLMTNDGDLADKLSHPRNGITKIYHVELSRNLTQGDFNKIAFGLELEDGLIKPDNISYVTGAGKNELGIQIHSGKNRIVRRIFEHLGYEVVKLDRVVYGNLTKKDLPRGRWRYLDEHELIQIKHLIQIK